MAEPYKLVQGDTAPQIKVTLTRSDTGDVIDLTEASTCQLHFRKKNTDSVLFSLSNQSGDSDQALGIAIFAFSGSQLDITPGNYEGEVEVVFTSGVRETVYETLDFVLRADFA